MARLPLVTEEQVSPNLASEYQKIASSESGLSATFQTLFNSPKIASHLVGLDELFCDEATLETWFRSTSIANCAQMPSFGSKPRGAVPAAIASITASLIPA